MPIDALSVLCAQLTRDLLAIAKFLFHFLSITERMIIGDLLAFLIVTDRLSRQSTIDANKIINPQYFRRHLANILIKIRINPEIRIRIQVTFD